MTTTPRKPENHRYELVDRIGVGGMAEVFRAKLYGPHAFEKVLAVKRILPALASDPSFVRRFVREAKLAVTLNHPNIVQVFDLDQSGESLYLAMEHIDGLDLATAIRRLRERKQSFPVSAALHVAVGILRGLEFAHERGVIHRDISPSNILLSRAGEVKIADFGIAEAADANQHTRSFRIVGKWRYMSPEQTRGLQLDARSDLFSAAVVIFEMLTGSRMFNGDDVADIVRAIRGDATPKLSAARPDLSADFDEFFASALARDRDLRTKTAGEMLEELLALGGERDEPVNAMALGRLVGELVGPVEPSEQTLNSRYLVDDEVPSPRSRPGQEPGSADRSVSAYAIAAAAAVRTRNDVRQWQVDGTLPSNAGSVVTENPDSGWPWRRATAIGLGLATAVITAMWAFGEKSEPPDRSRSESGAATAAAAAPARSADPMAAVATDAAPLGRQIPAIEPTVSPPSPPDAAMAARPVEAGAAVTPSETRETDDAGPTEEEKPRTGTIDLFVKPWANVYFHGRKIAEAPRRNLRLPIGRHKLELVNPVTGQRTVIRVEVPSRAPIRVTLPPK